MSASLAWQEIRYISIRAEELGYDSIWLPDHLMSSNPIVECWTTLSALANVLDSIRLGPLVLCNSFRNPALTAKMAASLDEISNGRLELGVGAGWKQDEYVGYGYEFPKPQIRLAQLEEGIEIARRIWSQDFVTFKGTHYQIREVVCLPKPVQAHVPITIGGTGNRMLRLIAKHGDRANWWLCPKELFSQRIKLLRCYEKEIQRKSPVESSATTYVNISSTRSDLQSNMERFYKETGATQPHSDWLKDVSTRTISGTPDECIETIRKYADLGVAYFMIRPIDLPGLKGLEVFAEKVLDHADAVKT